jgi:Cft2 family RNA processing exonuclease
MIEYNKGIHIKGTDLWLDARRKTPFYFVSHAHADHAVKHESILSTRETARFYEHRYGKTKFYTLAYNRTKKIRGAKIRLFPSGHILGGAQIVIEIGGVRIVYTGDFKLRASLTARRAQVKRCDILIMESTFGRPQYLFPKSGDVHAQMVGFVEKTRANREIPVFLAYSLGKAQEAVKILSNRGYRLSLHSSIYDICKIYEEFGVRLGDYQLFQNGNLSDRVLIFPPQAKRSGAFESIPRKRIAMLTGWAVDPEPVNHLSGSLCIPLSDHADFSELMDYVRKAKPQKIYAVHGFPEFVGFLKQKGFDAELLREGAVLKEDFNKEFLINYDLFATR